LKPLEEGGAPYTVCIEQFVMRGKGGESLNRLIGSYMASISPSQGNVIHVQNTSVKKVIAGHGHADKASVSAGLETFFSSNKESVAIVKTLTQRGEFDILDALAIGATGYLLSVTTT
jgi:Holliday junction resolvasome RuvABC endonuclease subunit